MGSKISVCIATYNGAKYLRSQLNSILKQLENDSEVIISDDGSVDDTLAIINSFADTRIKLLPNQTFRNPVYNFENALKNCQGDYIFLADQDDIWLPGRISKTLSFFTDYDLIVNDCSVVTEELEVLVASYFESIDAKRGFLRNLVRTSPYIGCCMAFRRKVLEKALPFPKHIPVHDFWIAMLSECLFRIKFVYEPLVLYRRHSSNFSPTASKNTNPIHRKIKYRVNTLVPLVFRLARSF
jgi:glycosyltransferase involved in cell wall biosynthesis